MSGTTIPFKFTKLPHLNQLLDFDELKFTFRILDSEDSLSLPPPPASDDGLPNSRDVQDRTWRDRKRLL